MSEPPEDIVTIELDGLDLDPTTAYARLSSYTPGRGSFLIESLDHEHPAGRYSVVGYRARSGEMLPPGVDCISAQLESARGPMPAGLPEAIARAAVGCFSYANAHSIHAIRHWDDEEHSGYFLRGCTVVVFDHAERRTFVAGRRQGRVAERCAWELRNGPSPAPLGPAPEPVASLQSALDDDQLAARASRAKRFLFDPLASLRIAQSYRSPVGELGALGMFRVLRARTRARAAYFIDFGSSPVAPQLHVFGTTDAPLVSQRLAPGAADGDDAAKDAAHAALDAELRGCFPHPATVGHAPLDAARVLRRLEETSRGMLGGLVGYVGPGPVAHVALAERICTVAGGWCELALSVAVGPDSDVAALGEAARQDSADERHAMQTASSSAGAQPREPADGKG